MGDSGSLVFNLARLGAPNLSLDEPVRFQLQQDLVHDALAVQRSSMPAAASAAAFTRRVEAGPTATGLLTLPQGFGAVYLGQAFAALVTVVNRSDTELVSFGLKVRRGAGRGSWDAPLAAGSPCLWWLPPPGRSHLGTCLPARRWSWPQSAPAWPSCTTRPRRRCRAWHPGSDTKPWCGTT